MKNDGQTFLAQLASLPRDSFESRFAEVSTRLGLDAVLNRNELTLLYEAALRATLCNVALNSLTRRNLILDVKDETTRIESETDFMFAREIFYASAGWQNLPASGQAAIQKAFLDVSVADDQLGC